VIQDHRQLGDISRFKVERSSMGCSKEKERDGGVKLGNWDLVRGFRDDYPVISCDPCRGVCLLLALTRLLLLPLPSLLSSRGVKSESLQAGADITRRCIVRLSSLPDTSAAYPAGSQTAWRGSFVSLIGCTRVLRREIGV
jgi:hypothetical protein